MVGLQNTTAENHESISRVPRKPMELIISMAILFSFVVLATMQVASRYVIDTPFIWTEELSGILLIWMTFLGSVAVVRLEGHIRVEIIDNLLGKRTTAWLNNIFDTVIVAFLVLLVLGGLQMISEFKYEVTPALRLPFRYVMVIVPISAVLMAFWYARGIIRRTRALLKEPNHGV